jgi:3-phenylpropionate/trans-cinnamate dioxygenase ferredoxin subunit
VESKSTGPPSEPLEACRIEDLEEGRIRCITLPNGNRVALVRVASTVRAFSIRCPHRGGPLDKGRIRYGILSDSPGDMALDESRMVINCPWHNWEFSLQSGESTFDSAKRMPVYRTDVVDGVVSVYSSASDR